jgi:GNAT superfamily N-acetyltransferase
VGAAGQAGRVMGTLVEVPYREVAPFRTVAARERVSLSDTPATRWFVWRAPGADAGRAGAGPGTPASRGGNAGVDGEWAIIGCCGLLLRPGGWARIKGVYVRPPYRGQGHGDAMTRALIAWARERCLSVLEVLAYNPAYYERLGWRRMGRPRPNGAVRLMTVL